MGASVHQQQNNNEHTDGILSGVYIDIFYRILFSYQNLTPIVTNKNSKFQ